MSIHTEEPTLVGVVQENSMDGLAARLASLPSEYRLAELRLDCCQDLDIARLQALLEQAGRPPVLFTLRPQEQGGHYTGSEESRLAMLHALAQLHPEYMDVEYTVAPAVMRSLQECAPTTCFIVSQHDFAQTPENLEALLTSLTSLASTCVCKLASYAHTTCDALRMLVLCRETQVPIIGICMGEEGATTRILAPVVGAGISYCPVTSSSAPGQLDASLLLDTYNYTSLNHHTAIYGLLGDPVAPSMGHIFHNAENRRTKSNAVYVKWRVTEDELSRALILLHRLGVCGLSVTMPLKEAVLPLLTHVDPVALRIGAVNTLVRADEGWHGHNTDGAGALQALGCSVTGKKVLLLGAGGSAKAIADTLLHAGADLWVLNRTQEKAYSISTQVIPYDALPQLAQYNYDILINTLPVAAQLPFSTDTFVPHATVMDITYAHASDLLAAAKRAGCRCIDGQAMFYAQARLQRQLWGLD